MLKKRTNGSVRYCQYTSSTRPVVVYRNSDGSFQCGFVMRSNEVVVSLSLLSEVRELAGLPVDDIQKQL
ncbi:hypothetical protein F7F04_28030 [Escherichia coli]|nr:hypothetical protein F7F04_28030 [Escherichia coli]